MIAILPGETEEKTKKPLGIYIHIPFCVRKCVYCDFLSQPVGTDCIKGSASLIERYVRSVCTELEGYAELSRGRRVQTIYIGGGTPSIISADYITLIMDRVRRTFDVAEDAEISIEVNPGTLTKEKALSYAADGINRMSIGLQSANDKELRTLGRIHNYDQFLAAFNTAREAGLRNINIDVMSGIPGQTMHSYLDTLDKVMRCRPEHISAYSLIVEEGTPLAGDERLLSQLPDEDTDRRMYDMTNRLLSSGSWKRYEISNYARPGFECRHNMAYWTLAEYIGVGAGAASFAGGRRYVNETNMERYMSVMERCRSELSYGTNRGAAAWEMRRIDETVSSERLMEEYMFLGLRMIKGVSAGEFNEKFGHSIYDVYGEVIGRYVASGHMKDDGGLISLTRAGIDVSNTVLADFLLD